MGGLFAASWDSFASKLQTQPMLIRKIRSESRHEVQDLKREEQKLEDYVKAIRGQNLANLQKSLGEHNKGFIVLLDNELELLFKELHCILKAYSKLLQNIKDFEADLSRIEATDSSFERDATFHQTVKDDINGCLKLIEKAFMSFIQNISGMESFSLKSALQGMILDPWSQQQVEIGDLKQARIDFREMKAGKKGLTTAIGNLQHQANDRLAEFNKRFEEYKKALQKEIADYEKIDSDILQLVKAAHERLQKLVSQEGRLVRLQDVDVKHAPSIQVLHRPVAQEGGGLPDKTYDELTKLASDLESKYRSNLDKLVSESRIFVSKVEHSEL